MPQKHETRCSGILLHVTSLPSRFGVGDFGPSAFEFVDLLIQSGQSLWQILPINPPSFGNSPYSCTSAFAISPLFVSPENLVRDGLLEESDLEFAPEFLPERVQYPTVLEFKNKILTKCYDRFKEGVGNDEFKKFCKKNSYWLDDFCLFSVLKNLFDGCSWSEWPEDIRKRNPDAMDRYARNLQEPLEKEKYFQFILFSQWMELKKYCQVKGVQVFGDVALYVNYDSADVWSHPKIFKLNQELKPVVVAGVPPDYFSETGQKWGNPVFDWGYLQQTGFAWWISRMKHNLDLFDLVRIDHFRGLLAAWEIPADEPTAINGQWQEGLGVEFFSALMNDFKSIPVVAEDLGVITQDVKDAMTRFGFPGMKLLIFAFDGDIQENPYAPNNHVKNCVLYTGTHDCNTVCGWFLEELSNESRVKLENTLGKSICADTVSDELIVLAMSSIADTVILPMQDVLGLGSEARMNCPGIAENNWEWRLLPGQWSKSITEKLSGWTKSNGRILGS
ncbi:MAG: 4-alpha-glucanotransferase [Nitrospina sp.]|jgi:4-alpha-glucanotransferase|nr:4-alpha-glucanotransferase [Nitrospina sp.]MBT5632483.1 4-alpha-glucanotransferase [Nitrospina sp.]